MNFATLAYTGFYQCTTCDRPTEPIGDPGEPWARCRYCHQATLVWIPPVLKPESLLALPAEAA